jgi:copper(I)-binding protein
MSIKPHQVVEFKPAGLHLMMRNMASEKILGDSFPVTLTFSNGDALEFHMTVANDPAIRPTSHMHLHDNPIDI